jgi:hypothetical protein
MGRSGQEHFLPTPNRVNPDKRAELTRGALNALIGVIGCCSENLPKIEVEKPQFYGKCRTCRFRDCGGEPFVTRRRAGFLCLNGTNEKDNSDGKYLVSVRLMDGVGTARRHGVALDNNLSRSWGTCRPCSLSWPGSSFSPGVKSSGSSPRLAPTHTG